MNCVGDTVPTSGSPAQQAGALIAPLWMSTVGWYSP